MLTYLFSCPGPTRGDFLSQWQPRGHCTRKIATDSETCDTTRPINGVAASVARVESMCRTGRRPPSTLTECTQSAIRPMIRLTTIAYVGGPGGRGSIYGSLHNDGYAEKKLMWLNETVTRN